MNQFGSVLGINSELVYLISMHFNSWFSSHFNTETHPSQPVIPWRFQAQNMCILPYISDLKRTYCSPISSTQTHPFQRPNVVVPAPISAPYSTLISFHTLAHLSPHFSPQTRPFLSYFVTKTHQ